MMTNVKLDVPNATRDPLTGSITIPINRGEFFVSISEYGVQQLVEKLQGNSFNTDRIEFDNDKRTLSLPTSVMATHVVLSYEFILDLAKQIQQEDYSTHSI